VSECCERWSALEKLHEENPGIYRKNYHDYIESKERHDSDDDKADDAHGTDDKTMRKEPPHRKQTDDEDDEKRFEKA
jgi:hypothetical protein